VRPEHLCDPDAGAAQRPRLQGRVKFVELLGAERLLQIELDATPVVADVMPEVVENVDGNAADTVRESAGRSALVTARFDAHARVDAGDLVEVAVTAERLHFFDLTTHRAIR
jgi:hypothetical protein